MPGKIIDRLLKVRCRFLTKNKPVPKTFRLKKDRIEQLGKEVLNYLSPNNVSGIIILGMRLVEVT